MSAKTKHFLSSAAQALSGVFLAEQIRQQQLASELQNHLQSSSSLTAMQALLNMGKLNSNGNLSVESARKQVMFALKMRYLQATLRNTEPTRLHVRHNFYL